MPTATNYFMYPWPEPPQDESKPIQPNKFKAGDKILVKAFDYGTGFEVVDSVGEPEADHTYYEIQIRRVNPSKREDEAIMYTATSVENRWADMAMTMMSSSLSY